MIKILVMVTSSRAVLVALAFAVSLVALRCDLQDHVGMEGHSVPGGAGHYISIGVRGDQCGPRGHANISAHSHNNGLRQGF
jgi:hypothetical protein